ncbi:succinate-semialdehyde dehydrogenase / glutarate-semialdehyde dehydrogenase [Paraburkholderia steynii]|uniref:Succinate-semialdehyde dehydrogenase / glutarate-semialdehyde dehydrogenase n=1 Tax=Paraburkholderia steynii TaxID=1245441 RepID=A0A7Z7BBB9_9BURK|nr:NAD-dependent succinate-semialdehyde dehydrogenase [Paraburkholderia steynii]SDI55570.1 succinate-semialdehyde dehydrogenase / glutarate-semialdehyde dehydrogenase [Paraburkholderia steynii]
MNTTTDETIVPALSRPELLRQSAYVGGTWLDVGEGPSIIVRNPATGDAIGSVPALDAETVRTAVSHAAHAFQEWRRVPAKQRARVLRAWHDKVIAHIDDLALILTTEQGKTLSEARGEIQYAASFIEWFAEEAKRINGDILPAAADGNRILVLKQPVGVCAAVTPWNFPAAMVTRKVAPALAAGCTVVLKPASATPFTALALAVLGEDAGIPPGVFNIVTGSARQIGDELCQNPLVRKLTFTGSTEVGRELMAKSATTIKKVSMELGGNAPFIVFDDANIPDAVAGAMFSKFRNSGQTCVCTNRILVQASVYDAFCHQFEHAVSKLRVGPGIADGIDQGPLIDAAAVAHLNELVADAEALGATVTVGGKSHSLGGNFFMPTVVRDVAPEMRLFREEAFGPIAPIVRFDTEEEGIALANDTEYGLAGYFFASRMDRVVRVFEALETGMVGINTGAISSEVVPFGGIKASGIGREGSKYGINDYLEIKAGVLAGAF